MADEKDEDIAARAADLATQATDAAEAGADGEAVAVGRLKRRLPGLTSAIRGVRPRRPDLPEGRSDLPEGREDSAERGPGLPERGPGLPERRPASPRWRPSLPGWRPGLPGRSGLPRWPGRPGWPGEAARAAARNSRNAAWNGVNWLTSQVVEMAPRIKVRDRAELLRQFPGRDVEDLADVLVDGAARATAAAGGAAGLAAVLPVLPAFPAEVAAETLVVVGIEIKLIAELHEIYGVPAPGSTPQRMGAYVAAWAHRRGVAVIPGGVAVAAGSPIASLLRRRLTARAGRSALSLGPLLTGAAAGAYLNSRETRRLGQQVRRDLRRRLWFSRCPIARFMFFTDMSDMYAPSK